MQNGRTSYGGRWHESWAEAERREVHLAGDIQEGRHSRAYSGWFAEKDGKLYVMTRNDMWKYKRIRNNPEVRVAACNIRGKVTGPEFHGRAQILPREQWEAPRALIRRKYWLARLPFWSRKNEFIEILLSN